MKETPQIYAERLVEQYYNVYDFHPKYAIQCAIIDVTNTIDALGTSSYNLRRAIYYNEVLTILKDKL